MTSAAELLYTRRSRYDRNDHESDTSPEMNHHLGFNHRHHHRRSQHHRHGSNRISHSVRESDRVFEDAIHCGSSNVVDIESLINGLRLAGNERLPEDVLLAKERLVQRLRGVSLSEHKSPCVSLDPWDKSTYRSVAAAIAIVLDEKHAPAIQFAGSTELLSISIASKT